MAAMSGQLALPAPGVTHPALRLPAGCARPCDGVPPSPAGSSFQRGCPVAVLAASAQVHGFSGWAEPARCGWAALALAAVPVLGRRPDRRRWKKDDLRTRLLAFPLDRVRREFPALRQQVRPGVPLVYLDNAATSQKPASVLEELERFYSSDNSNVHRGMHTLSVRSTEAFEGARTKVAQFIGAACSREIIFTRNATEAMNLVARTWGAANIAAGDEIVLTVMEHHSNLVPWQQLAESAGASLRFVGVTSEGLLDRAEFERLLNERTRLVSMCHVSNVLGCVNPIEWVVEKAHAVGAKVLVDACQSVPNMPVDVQKLGADWLVASSHKMCGPTGVGFLWGKAELLRASPPFLGGGEMIDEVSLQRSTYADIPHKLEAGTPAFAEAVALGAACDYLSELSMTRIQEQERLLTEHLWRRLSELPGVTLYGPPPSLEPERAALACFNVEGCHAHDLATLVDQDRGVAMRAGHHCCQPLHAQLGVTASARLSAYFYNTTDEIDTAITALRAAAELLRGEAGAGGLDLFAMGNSTNQLGAGFGPPTVLEALQERGLVDDASEAGLLASPVASVGVFAAFEPSAGALRLRDLPKLAFLRWCQLYGHKPLCLIDSAAAVSLSPERLEHSSFLLRSCLERALEDEQRTQAVVVDSREWFGKLSVLDFLGQEVAQLEGSATSGRSLAETARPLLRAWAAAKARELHEVVLQAGHPDEAQIMAMSRDLPPLGQHDVACGSLTLNLGPEAADDSISTPDDLSRLLLTVSDGQVVEMLRRLTLLPLGEVDSVASCMDEPGYTPGFAQRRLAEEAIRLVFGEGALQETSLLAGTSTEVLTEA